MVVEFSCPNIALVSTFINIYNIKKRKESNEKRNDAFFHVVLKCKK